MFAESEDVIEVNAEVAVTDKLERVERLGVHKLGGYKAILFHDERLGIYRRNKLVVGEGSRVLNIEQTVVKAHFCFYAVRTCPVNGTLDLSAVGAVAALCSRVVGAVNAGDLTVFVLFARNTGKEIRAFKTDFVAGEHSEILLGRIFEEVGTLDVNFLCEGDARSAHLGVVGVALNFERFGLSVRIVVDNDLNGVEHRHGTRRVCVKLISYTGFEQTVIDNGISL